VATSATQTTIWAMRRHKLAGGSYLLLLGLTVGWLLDRTFGEQPRTSGIARALELDQPPLDEHPKTDRDIRPSVRCGMMRVGALKASIVYRPGLLEDASRFAGRSTRRSSMWVENRASHERAGWRRCVRVWV
jgi:hypothetical protein